MSDILIKDLPMSGADLLSGKESYLDEMSEQELYTSGGWASTPYCIAAAVVVARSSRNCVVGGIAIASAVAGYLNTGED